MSYFVLLSQACFAYQVLLLLHSNFRIICPGFVKHAIGILIEIASNLWIALGSMDILIVIPPIH